MSISYTLALYLLSLGSTTPSQGLYSGITEEDIEQFKNIIFEGIDMRQRKELVNKSQLIHTLINNGVDKLDVSYMCVELVLTLWKTIINDKRPHFSYPYCFSSGVVNKPSKPFALPITQGLLEIEEIYKQRSNKREYDYYYEENERNRYVHLYDIWGLVLLCIAEISDHNCRAVQHRISVDNNCMKYIRKYWGMLQIGACRLLS